MVKLNIERISCHFKCCIFGMDRRQARLWNYLNSIDWYPIREWPLWIQNKALLEYKNNRTRFELFYFLTANGLHPEKAIEIIKIGDVIRGEPKSFVYNQKGERHFEQLLKQAKDESFYSKKFYSLLHKRVI